MVTSVKKKPNVRVYFEKLERLDCIFGLEHPISSIREHIGCPHSLKYIVVDDHN